MLGPLLELIPQIRATLQSLGKDRLLPTHDEYRASWASPFLTRQNNSNGLVDVHAMHALMGIAETIDASGGGALVIEQSARDRLRQALVSAMNEVRLDGDLPRELRSLLLTRLGDLLWALDHYDIQGVDGLQAALERLMAVVATCPQPARDRPSWRAALAPLAIAFTIFSQGASIEENAASWGRMIPEVMDVIRTELTPQIEAGPAGETADSALDVVDAEVLADD